MKTTWTRSLSIASGLLVILSLLLSSVAPVQAESDAPPNKVFLPMLSGNREKSTPPPTPPVGPTPTSTPPAPPPPVVPSSGNDWPQLGQNAQRTNSTNEQVDPPYCYAWKWYGVPFASRMQPVVSEGRLFAGGMDGVLYARHASAGDGLWSFTTGGPIRHSPGVGGQVVVVSSHDGFTYGLNVVNGAQLWRAQTGPSATAPLIDAPRNRVFVGSTDGRLTALSLSGGQELWRYQAGAAVMTSPSLSQDGSLVYLGSEAMQAIALRADNGSKVWQVTLPGQSLSERYPVVTSNAVFYRSQPLIFFHTLLQSMGDDVMNQAGSVLPDWAADWGNVRGRIVSYLNGNPAAQSFFALNPGSGASLGTAPVLYTYGNNDIPAAPVVQNGSVYTVYRARHGIQTDAPTVHVTTQYDAELGRMFLPGLDIEGLRGKTRLSGQPEFRLTSDEPAVLTMGGNILWVDNWERLGGINTQTGELIPVANVSNDWPECYANCGPGGPRPFFPLNGGTAYPFPAPREGEGHSRGGLVIANGMLYWRVVEGGIGALTHDADGTCAAPRVHTQAPRDPLADLQPADYDPGARSLAEYVTTDLTTPPASPAPDLVERIRGEVRAMLTAAGGQHLMPLYLERGFSSPAIWPYNDSKGGANGMPYIHYGYHGNVFWQDPGELLYTMALAYPYLDGGLQAELKTYMAAEMGRYPPLQDLPWGDPNRDWLKSGRQRELYSVPFRAQLSSWPPPSVNLSVLYGLWLWSKNTGDWSYAQGKWSTIEGLFNAKSGNIRYYADIAGLIGYTRLAAQIKGTGSAQYQSGLNAAVSALQNGLNFAAFRDRANGDYKDPRDLTTGWNAPVLFGMTPEIGLYLREQFGGQVQTYLTGMETYNERGEGLIWWYLTQAGAHAQEGETSNELPFAAWSHFLGHAYIIGEPQAALRKYLDRPLVPGDLYSIQKLAAALQAR